MKRIRYKRNIDRPIYYSGQYLAGKKILHATIIHREDGDNPGYQVIINDLDQGILLYDELCKSYEKAKKVVKEKFKEYGLKIDDEVRKKVE